MRGNLSVQSQTINHTFEFSLEHLIAARESRYTDREFWPEIEDIEVLRDETKDGVEYKERIVHVAMGSGSPILNLTKANRIAIHETSEYEQSAGEFRLIAKLNSFQAVLNFDEKSLYYSIDPKGGQNTGRCGRTVEIKAEVKIPLIGKNMTKMVLKEFADGSNVDKERLETYYYEKLASDKGGAG